MMHIKPITEKNALPHILNVYGEIKTALQLDVVPLLFQYIANYEDYFSYTWKKIRANLESPYFASAHQDIVLFADTTTERIYTPSNRIQSFLQNLSPVEKQHIAKTVQTLELINSKLLLLTIGMREGLKGLYAMQQAQVLPRREYGQQQKILDEILSMNNEAVRDQNLTYMNRMLAPLFGAQSLTISNYPDFFYHIASEMKMLMKQVYYLEHRVLLEQKGIVTSKNFSHPLGFSYSEIARFIKGKPYFHELLYLLIETFPTQFPRLVFTSSIMKYVLDPPKTPSGISRK